MYLVHNRDGFLVIPWSATSPHLQDNTANTPNVNFEGVALLVRLDYFWCHPKHGSLHGGEGGALVHIVGSLRNTEIRYLADARKVDEDVVSFEIL